MKFISIRILDELGRIVLPMELRRLYGLDPGDSVNVIAAPYDFILVKATKGTGALSIDELGRIFLPEALTEKYDIQPGDSLAIVPEENGLHLHLAGEADIMPEVTDTKPSPNAETYIKDYTENRTRYHELMSRTNADMLWKRIQESGIFAEISRKYLETPHIINPAGKEAYDKALEMLDVWVMKHNGKIHGEVSYDEFDAKIIVTMPFFEYTRGNMEILQFLIDKARRITFEPTPFGDIRLYARFDYFTEADDRKKAIDEVLANHADMFDGLDTYSAYEKDAILADPEMSAFIAKRAEQQGITPREYLDLLETMLSEDSDALLKKLHKQSRKEQELEQAADEE